MNTQILNGKKIRKEILEEIKSEVSKLNFQPVFCDVLVGEDKVSAQYVRMKQKMAESLGIHFHSANFPSSINIDDLLKEIGQLNKIPNMCGIIVQLPLPSNIDKRVVLDAIDPDLDVDCLGTKAGEKFYNGDIDVGFPTAMACMKILDSVGVSLKNKKIVVLGRGELVGRPVRALLEFRGLEVEVISSKTENKEEIMRSADVIISGIGKGAYITGDKIKEGAIVIDAGTSESNNSIVGDVNLDSVIGKAGYVSPVPGGVGPVTVAMLFANVLNVAKNKAI